MKTTKKQAACASISCFVNPDWRETGLARIAVAHLEGKKVSAAIFLVDIFCLGVKDVMSSFRSMKEFETILTMMYIDTSPEAIPYDQARNIVLGAVEYAKQLGFDPHPDFTREKYLLGDENIGETDIKFGGPDGKPLYVIGPNDQPENVVQTLESRLGEDGFTVISPDSI